MSPNDDYPHGYPFWGWRGPEADDEDGYPNIFGGMFGSRDEDGDDQEAQSGFQFFGIGAVVLIVFIFIFYLLYKFVIFSAILVLKSIPELYTIPGLTIISFLILWVLFWLKEKARIIYGLVELAFAIVTSWVSVGAAITGNANWLIVLAAIYVIVRGLDNINSGSGNKLLSPHQVMKKSSDSQTPAIADPQNE